MEKSDYMYDVRCERCDTHYLSAFDAIHQITNSWCHVCEYNVWIYEQTNLTTKEYFQLKLRMQPHSTFGYHTIPGTRVSVYVSDSEGCIIHK